MCLDYGLQCPSQAGEVAVVDAAVIQLTGQFAEQTRPVTPTWDERNRHLDAALNDLHGGQARGRGSALFPGAVPAGG